MSDRIEQVMSAEEWKAPEDVIAGYIDAETGIIDVTLDGSGGAARPRSTWALMALLNSWLPDSDPRKITREKISNLRIILQVYIADATSAATDGWSAEEFLDALESYLPPA